MATLLIVEDDKQTNEAICEYLKSAGHKIVPAFDGLEALKIFEQENIDLVVLDIMLPKIDGYGVCEVIRQKSNVPIIMLTALDGEESQIKGLDLQADDYITKPFSMPVLIRKIAAILRRTSKQEDTPHIMSYKDLTLDLDGYKVYSSEGNIELTTP